MNPFLVFFFLFYLKPWCTPVLVGLWYCVSLTLSSAGVKGVNLREICLFTTGQKTRGLQRDMPRSVRTPKCFGRRSSGPDVGTLVCCFSCIMWFKGMFGTDWEKNKKKIPPLIAFHKCQENLQDRGLCDRATAEERLSGGGGGGSAKRLHVLQGLFRFPIWHFLYDDDDFNAPDVIMSRIFSSVDVRGVAFRGSSLSNPFGIQRDLPPTWRNYKQTRAGFIARSCFYIYFTPRWSERV